MRVAFPKAEARRTDGTTSALLVMPSLQTIVRHESTNLDQTRIAAIGFRRKGVSRCIHQLLLHTMIRPASIHSMMKLLLSPLQETATAGPSMSSPRPIERRSSTLLEI